MRMRLSDQQRLPHSRSSSGVALSATYSLTPQDFKLGWEAYSLTKSLKDLDSLSFEGFKNELLKSRGSRGTKRQTQVGVTLAATPSNKRKAPEKTEGENVPTRILPKYEDRSGAGDVVVSYNPNKFPGVDNDGHRAACVVSTAGFEDTNALDSFQFMFSTMEERAKALADHLQTKQDHLMEACDLGKEGEVPLEAVHLPRQNTVCCVGRICSMVRH